MLPEGWRMAAVGEMGHVQAGRQRSPGFSRGALRPYLRVANVLDGWIDDQDVNQMQFIDAEFARYQLKPNDVLLNEGQSLELVDRPALYVGSPPDCCFQNTLIRFRSSREVLPEFALFQFQRCLYDGTFQSIAKQTTSIAHLGVSRFAELILSWPPLAEQRHIAQILTTWNEAIATAKHLLNLSQTERELTAQALLSGRLRRGMHPPWRATRLDQMIRESRALGSGGDRARKLTVKLYGRGVIAKGMKRAGSESTQYYRRRAGQFIYSKLDFLNGAFGLIPPELDGYESTLDLPAFDFLPGVEPRWFLQHVSREAFYQDHLGLANGGRKARRVNPVDLLRISIDLPCLAEQRAIAEAVDLSINVVQSRRRLVGLLKTEKTALMTGLLTGKHHVRQHDAGATP